MEVLPIGLFQLIIRPMGKCDLTNHLLVAMPSMEDPFFRESVIYIARHNKGMLGVAVNVPMGESKLSVVFEQLKIKATHAQETPLYIGGPLNGEFGLILYKDNKKNHGLEISGSKQILKEIAAGEGPSDFIVTLGCISWDHEQLMEEIQSPDWLIAPARPDILTTPVNQRWAIAASFLGVDIHQVSSLVGRA